MPEVTVEKNEKVGTFVFSDIYPHYLNRILKRDRTKEELDTVLKWFTGYSQGDLDHFIEGKQTYATFFESAQIHPKSDQIKGVVCGYRIENIPDEFALYRDCRKMEKLIDELARGRAIEKIMR